MSKKIKLNLICLLLFSCCVNLQTTGQPSKFRYFISPDTSVIVTQVLPSFGWDTRLSFISADKVAFKGVRVGIRLGKKRHRLTASYRWFSFAEHIGLLREPWYRMSINPRYFTQLDGFFYAISYQHIFFDTYRFAGGVVTDLGLGATYNETLSFRENTQIFKRSDRFVPCQLGIYGEFKATRFAGVTAQVGYRWVKNYSVQPSINDLYVGIGSRLYFGSIYRSVRNKKLAALSPHI